MNLEICNYKKEEDLYIIAEEFSNYYKNLEIIEDWNKDSAFKLFHVTLKTL